jgi:hypothetical protein
MFCLFSTAVEQRLVQNKQLILSSVQECDAILSNYLRPMSLDMAPTKTNFFYSNLKTYS